MQMPPGAFAIALLATALVCFSAGWVFRDARARGIPLRKAITWAALQAFEWPVFFLLYRRARPTRVKATKG